MRLRLSKSLLAAVSLILTVSAGNSAIADGICASEAVKGSGIPCERVATAQKSAVLQVPGDPKSGVALEVIARPVAGDTSLPYLVVVSVPDGSGTPKLLGSFSFYPARIGEARTFVLPKLDSGSDGKHLTLSVKLIPANPARDIKDAAVEILSARIVGK